MKLKKSIALGTIFTLILPMVPISSAAAEAGKESLEKNSLAVLDLDNKGGLEGSQIILLSAAVRDEFFLSGRYEIMSPAEMNDRLQARGIELTVCSTEACIRMVGKVLGVEKLVVGTIEKLGRIYILTLQLVDVVNGEIEETASDEYLGPAGELIGPIKKIARKIARVSLPPTLEGIRIVSAPEGATVYLNGEPRGHTPLLLPELEPGEYRLRIVLKEHEQYEEVFTLIPGEMREVSVPLTPLPLPGAPGAPPPGEAAPRTGLVTLNIEPYGADVRIDGKVVGKSPLESLDIEAGDHELRILYPGYQEFTTRIRVEADKHMFLKGSLKALEREEAPPQAVSFRLLKSLPFPENPRPYRLGSLAATGLAFITAGVFYYLTNQAANEYSDAIDQYRETYDTCYDQGTCYGNEDLAGFRDDSEKAEDDFYSYRTWYYLSLGVGTTFLGIAGYLMLGEKFRVFSGRPGPTPLAVGPLPRTRFSDGPEVMGFTARVRF